jgi:predicted DNA-binding protein YlxM (UPF0122 family)
MGRKSSLTADQWVEIERRHVVGGESMRTLAEEFGINESSLRRKIKPQNAAVKSRENPLIVIAKEKVRIDSESRHIAAQIAELPYAKQSIVSDLARKLTNTSEHLGSAAELGAASSHRLLFLANQQLDKLDDVDPTGPESMEFLKGIAALTRTANESSTISLNLLAANKDVIKKINAPEDRPMKTLNEFYGE